MFTFTSILTESECDDNCKSQLVLRFYEKLSWQPKRVRGGVERREGSVPQPPRGSCCSSSTSTVGRCGPAPPTRTLRRNRQRPPKKRKLVLYAPCPLGTWKHPWKRARNQHFGTHISMRFNVCSTRRRHSPLQRAEI